MKKLLIGTGCLFLLILVWSAFLPSREEKVYPVASPEKTRESAPAGPIEIVVTPNPSHKH